MGSVTTTVQEPGQKPLLGRASSYLGVQNLCNSSSLKTVACTHPTTGNALCGREVSRQWVKFSCPVRCSKHNIKEPLDFQLAEKKRCTSAFILNQPTAHCMHSVCQLTQRGRVMVDGTSTPLLSAMQEKLFLKHQVADVANILRFHCPVMSLGSGSNDYLIFLHTSLVRPRTNEAVLWVGEVTAEEEQRASEKRGRDWDFKSRMDGMSCKGSKQLRKQEMGSSV